MIDQPKKRTRASSSEHASAYRKRGMKIQLIFAKLIGKDKDYTRDPKAKKDVVDMAGDAYSVKSGEKKWQIFLYRKSHLENDDVFSTMNGLGQLMINCIDCFPQDINKYKENRVMYKKHLEKCMIEFAEKLQDKRRLKALLGKSMFNGSVNYLTVYTDNKFHVFWGKEVTEVMTKNLEVTNSKARNSTQMSNQKVVLQYESKNLGELEVRNDGGPGNHYRELLFNMYPKRAMKLLTHFISQTVDYSPQIIVHGEARKHFGKE